jgi:hypothetical protein
MSIGRFHLVTKDGAACPLPGDGRGQSGGSGTCPDSGCQATIPAPLRSLKKMMKEIENNR